jgi:cellulose synthase/poly-beta-1,6-N-acetylglucosamine synthase-like glycosyltransferase
MSLDFPNLHYTSRKKPAILDYKAGNLNNGLSYTKQLGDPAELAAGLDADVIVNPDWLRAAVSHLLKNPKMALVGLAQVRRQYS